MNGCLYGTSPPDAKDNHSIVVNGDSEDKEPPSKRRKSLHIRIVPSEDEESDQASDEERGANATLIISQSINAAGSHYVPITSESEGESDVNDDFQRNLQFDPDVVHCADFDAALDGEEIRSLTTF